jgi:hypothetical protein
MYYLAYLYLICIFYKLKILISSIFINSLIIVGQSFDLYKDKFYVKMYFVVINIRNTLLKNLIIKNLV